MWKMDTTIRNGALSPRSTPCSHTQLRARHVSDMERVVRGMRCGDGASNFTYGVSSGVVVDNVVWRQQCSVTSPLMLSMPPRLAARPCPARQWLSSAFAHMLQCLLHCRGVQFPSPAPPTAHRPCAASQREVRTMSFVDFVTLRGRSSARRKSPRQRRARRQPSFLPRFRAATAGCVGLVGAQASEDHLQRLVRAGAQKARAAARRRAICATSTCRSAGSTR